jgi:hypothetical protein
MKARLHPGDKVAMGPDAPGGWKQHLYLKPAGMGAPWEDHMLRGEPALLLAVVCPARNWGSLSEWCMVLVCRGERAFWGWLPIDWLMLWGSPEGEECL